MIRRISSSLEVEPAVVFAFRFEPLHEAQKFGALDAVARSRLIALQRRQQSAEPATGASWDMYAVVMPGGAVTELAKAYSIRTACRAPCLRRRASR